MCTSRRHSIPHARSYPAAEASRVHSSAPPPPPDADPGSRSYLDFAVVAEDDGCHSVVVTYDHSASIPLALGFAFDRAQTRTVLYPPLVEGATRRTLAIDVQMRRGPGVIRVAEGQDDARLHVHSLRVTRVRPGEDAGAGVAVPPVTDPLPREPDAA
ncbi:hypothetical protein ITJ44_06005 [Clavibacter sp. VKM Ac-2873]|uniref:hypothetical protein n=1 Tax=Clavibacter sp. VKM Ac-2873 TaxID=2783813 RepID=UPI00188AB987|nr:hypothetical protein [Clavibacter sp. VKM Ac-2873]MBF4617626.1 hypothetical protein [Clavibacter sp. VKM Ac-2873]